MKKFLFASCIALVATFANAQTATDFTANDCNGNAHNLYGELNAGKVIVLCWVMPCGACTGPATTAYNMVQGYQTSNPNTVFFYMADDYANSSCFTINGWANGISIPQSAFSQRFSNADIDMTDYGSTGMPKIVVIGGSGHTVFYNANNTVNATALQNAIDAAISTTGIKDPSNSGSTFTMSPNPASASTEIKFSVSKSSEVSFRLYNLEGKLVDSVKTGNIKPGDHTYIFNTTGYPSGTYLLEFNDGHKPRYSNLVISH